MWMWKSSRLHNENISFEMAGATMVNGEQAVQDESQIRNGAKVTVTIPEKLFSQWLKEDSKTTRLKIWCDLAKESFPYITVLLIIVLTIFVYREALIAVVPPLTWTLYNLWKTARLRIK
jgi:hypothetical protein